MAKTENENRSATVHVRLTEQEKQDVALCAKHEHRSMSDWCALTIASKATKSAAIIRKAKEGK